MKKVEQELFKSVAIKDIVYLNIERGLVYIPGKQIDPDAGNNGEIFKGYIGYNTDKQLECCVKKFPIPSYNQSLFDKLYQELIFGRQLVHKNIVKFFECSYSNNNFYIFMEYCNGQSLAQKMSLGYEDDLMSTKIFPEEYALNIMQQVIDALIYMKQLSYDGKSGAVHRDIKPDNIMFSNDVPKLIDFGMARFMDRPTVTPYKGSPIYMSPQNLRQGQYDLEKNDVWGIGMILYQLVEGVFPWKTELTSIEDLKKAQESIRNNIKFSNKVSTGLQKLIRHMLQYEEKDRCSWEQVVEYDLMKPYFCHLHRPEINEMDRLVQNYELVLKLQTELKLEKINKYVLDLTLTKTHQLKEFLPKNSQLDQKINQLYLQRILQKRKFHKFKSETALQRKLSQILVKYLEQMIVDTIDEVQLVNLNFICQIVISLYKKDLELQNDLTLDDLLQLARL
ncbi:unnamed protein product [Paramecium octaurelia]|uniref:Protein kinase domain-containing protein n=1 Tax=Paramecium octaurelia TaxID=43137 RepID=A0A8S1VDJ0_PAROT|nr:unnamed protein product [Paramecium octaurelia]